MNLFLELRVNEADSQGFWKKIYNVKHYFHAQAAAAVTGILKRAFEMKKKHENAIYF